MRVLVACECSGRVRDAFIRKGHDAISCDLKPTDRPGPHYQGSVFDIINDGWDMMIGHPPCTYISYAGTQSWNNKGRIYKRLKALKFFADLWESNIPKICLENPKSCASPVIAKYSQEIQPYYFGDEHLKTTWLWLKNLPPLKHYKESDLFFNKTHTKRPKPLSVEASGKKRYFSDISRVEIASGSTGRSKTFQGIANAMADQWG